MKPFLFSIVVFVFFFTLTAQATKNGKSKVDSLSCLKIVGRVLNADETNGDCIVELIGLNDNIDTITLKEGKIKFKFVLNKDSYYAIRISKAGYLSKLVCVNTEILTELNGISVFEFETTLIKDVIVQSLNQDALDFPVAIIHFDYQLACFSYNKEYSESIKRELYTVKPSAVKGSRKQTLKPISPKTFASAVN